LSAGLSNAEIAAALVISPATARTYVSRLLTKLDARDRSPLAASSASCSTPSAVNGGRRRV
jgi:DNA-binding NarL/FixJ family response regulator